MDQGALATVSYMESTFAKAPGASRLADFCSAPWPDFVPPLREFLVDFGTYIVTSSNTFFFDDRLDIGNSTISGQDNNGFIVLDLDAIDVTREIAGVKISVSDIVVGGTLGANGDVNFFSYDFDGGDIAALQSGVFDSVIFDDLGTGTEYATFEVTQGQRGETTFELLSQTLVQDLEQALADGDDLFALGLAGTVPSQPNTSYLAGLAIPDFSELSVDVVYEDQIL